MAEKMDVEGDRRLIQPDLLDLNPQHDDQTPAWTEDLPREFAGWGPQTPDPQNPSPAVDFLWTGEGSDHRHQVWRFDGHRHH